MADWKSIFYSESRFGGITDIDGIVVFYLRVNALAASKDLDFGCGQGTYANDPVPIWLGVRFSMFSVPFADLIEAIALCKEITGKKINVTYVDGNRIGDPIRYINNTRKFQSHDLSWRYTRLSRPLGW